MVLNYFRQAWRLLRQNRLFSAIYIAGTALAIATTTIFAVIYYVKIEPVYPEYNRHRTAYVTNGQVYSANGRSGWGGLLGLDLLDRIRHLPGVTTFTAVKDRSWYSDFVGLPGKKNDVRAFVKGVDPQFFKVYEFDFLEGTPLGGADFDGGAHSAIITDGLATQLFGTARGIVGRDFQLNYDDYRVTGVVRSGSSLARQSFATLYIPYTSIDGYDSQSVPNMGGYAGILLTDSLEEVRRATAEIVRRYNSSQDEYTLELWTQPQSHLAKAISPFPGRPADIGSFLRSNGLILLILLLVPALNLSGMISGRMETRGAELGVRRSFGARRRHLISQVVWENLALTLIGGCLGLLLTWLLLWLSGGTLLTLVDRRFDSPVADVTLTPDMLFAPAIFGIVLVLTVFLNLLSAFIPAWISSRRPIVKSLKEK